ncbi:MAG: cysteine--tRNA ligase [Fibrobacter sp.]|jgi:cysteinyl-tRNA synthetase|nr:cysteine--tRNA ligase [Fibrobacter sp.]
MMPLSFYNTASRRKEVFTLPKGDNTVKMYACGPTVYHFAHIGNLRTYLFEDLLHRTLKYYGYGLNHVVNITDVGHLTSDQDEGEDKMEKGAARTGKTVWEVAAFYTQAFMEDWKRLNIQEPTTWSRATDFIPEQIKLVQILEEKGFTYRTSDGIYFDSLKFPRYADFAKLDIENLRKGSRIDMGEKHAATDFALWKFSPKDTKRAMEWDSPWGVGFPGWHVECSAMAMKLLGETIDIHCGGTDHIRVHHTNEIAQSECATGKPFARFWMHGEFLRMGTSGGKMSKSTGEFLTLSLLMEKGFNPLDYRLFALTSHYRNYLNFTWEALESAKESLKSLHKKTDPLIGKATAIISAEALQWQAEFKEAIGDDLNIPRALGILNSVLKTDIPEGEKATLVLDFDSVFGLKLNEEREDIAPKSDVSVEEIEVLIHARTAARASKNWKESDRIRDELSARGIEIKDGPNGTTWSYK